MDLVRVAVLASVLGAPAAAEIIKPWREWLCNYCAMGEPDLDNIAVTFLVDTFLANPIADNTVCAKGCKCQFSEKEKVVLAMYLCQATMAYGTCKLLRSCSCSIIRSSDFFAVDSFLSNESNKCGGWWAVIMGGKIMPFRSAK